MIRFKTVTSVKCTKLRCYHVINTKVTDEKNLLNITHLTGQFPLEISLRRQDDFASRHLLRILVQGPGIPN